MAGPICSPRNSREFKVSRDAMEGGGSNMNSRQCCSSPSRTDVLHKLREESSGSSSLGTFRLARLIRRRPLSNTCVANVPVPRTADHVEHGVSKKYVGIEEPSP